MKTAPVNILLVDDSPTVLNYAKLILQSRGIGVHVAEDGEQGLQMAKKLNPSAIFIDYVLPGMTGQDFCELLSQDQQLQNVPLILMTSKGDDLADRLQAEFTGMQYLAKPFEPEDLFAVLDLALAETG